MMMNLKGEDSLVMQLVAGQCFQHRQHGSGFGLGSGLGYLLAVMLVTEAQNRLRSRAIQEAFRGLPITLIYIGVLALAIYGFTGHSVIL